MIRILLYLLEKFGMDVVQITLISFFGWKILTNHFKHLRDDITVIKEKVETIEKTYNSHAERISNIEGKLS